MAHRGALGDIQQFGDLGVFQFLDASKQHAGPGQRLEFHEGLQERIIESDLTRKHSTFRADRAGDACTDGDIRVLSIGHVPKSLELSTQLASAVERDISDNFAHPGPEVGSRFEPVRFADADNRGLLKNIVRVGAIGNHAHGHEPQRAVVPQELSGKIGELHPL